MSNANRAILAMLLLLLLAVLLGCKQYMADGSRLKPLERGTFFPDGQTSRTAIAGTVPFSPNPPSKVELWDVEPSKIESINEMPMPVNAALLQRGQRLFDIYCAVCHGRDGSGNGVIVRHGFSPPPSYHSDSLRKKTLGHYYSVISNGFGAMYSYADRVEPADRWAIIAYIRALQLSQFSPLESVPPEFMPQFRKGQAQ